MTSPLNDQVAEMLKALESNSIHDEIRARRVSGPTCRLDQETFELLAARYGIGHFGEGIAEGFMKIRHCLKPDQFRKVHDLAARKRKLQGKHLVRVMLTLQEKESLIETSKTTGLSEAKVLLATSFLYFRTQPEDNL